MAHIWPLIAVGIVGIGLAVAAWTAVSVWERRLLQAKFNDVAGDYATVLQNGLDTHLDKIFAVRAFYDASIEVDRREFKQFASQLLAGHDDTMQLLWCPRIDGVGRAAFEHQVRKSGLEHFSIRNWAQMRHVHTALERVEYFPVLYSTASLQNRESIGTDLNSERARSQAIARARDDDILAVAQGVQLRNPIDGKSSGLLGLPASLQTGSSS